MSDLLGRFADQQFSDPLVAVLSDAEQALKSQLANVFWAMEALKGNHLGVTMNGNGAHYDDEHELPSGPIAALPAAPMVHSMDADKVNLHTMSLKDFIACVFEAAAKHSFIGVVGEPGAMKATEAMEVMIRWGWRPHMVRPQATVAATLTVLHQKDGVLTKLGRGDYRHVAADELVAPKSTRKFWPADDEGNKVFNLNGVSTKTALFAVMRGSAGELHTPSEWIDRMVAAGWRANAKSNNSIRTMLSHCFLKSQVTRVQGRYGLAVRSPSRSEQ